MIEICWKYNPSIQYCSLYIRSINDRGCFSRTSQIIVMPQHRNSWIKQSCFLLAFTPTPIPLCNQKWHHLFPSMSRETNVRFPTKNTSVSKLSDLSAASASTSASAAVRLVWLVRPWGRFGRRRRRYGRSWTQVFFSRHIQSVLRSYPINTENTVCM